MSNFKKQITGLIAAGLLASSTYAAAHHLSELPLEEKIPIERELGNFQHMDVEIARYSNKTTKIERLDIFYKAYNCAFGSLLILEGLYNPEEVFIDVPKPILETTDFQDMNESCRYVLINLKAELYEDYMRKLLDSYKTKHIGLI